MASGNRLWWKRFLTLSRRTPLKRGAELRRTPFRPNRKVSKGEFTPAAKAEMRVRSGGRCEAGTTICRGHAVLFHHIKRRGQGGKGVASNGLHLCVPCHTFLHDHPKVAYARGWLIRSGNADEGRGDPDAHERPVLGEG